MRQKNILGKTTISGWGLNSYSQVNLIQPENLDKLQEFVSKAPSQSIIARGLGSSYGDAAQLKDRSVIELSHFDYIKFHRNQNLITAGAGVSLEKILKFIIPKGLFLPVTPGTKNITVGGAIAADVHGKNHLRDGSFGNYVKSILLIDGNGHLRELNPDNRSSQEYFWATVGGMGLTGIIVEATFALLPISSSFVSVDTKKYRDIDSLMSAMKDACEDFKYNVAWIDGLDKYGRGILTSANHIDYNQLSLTQKKKPLTFSSKRSTTVPFLMPNRLLNRFTISAFNELLFSKTPLSKEFESQDIIRYFYPLDSINKWNRLYGKKGFLQYQFVIPDRSSRLVFKVIETIKQNSSPGYLTVLKRFGKSNMAPLSFPTAGWSLAIDIPSKNHKQLATLDKVDQLISSAGGRIYLAKDSRQSSKIFSKTYPKLKYWQMIKRELDPNFIFTSDLYNRITEYK